MRKVIRPAFPFFIIFFLTLLPWPVLAQLSCPEYMPGPSGDSLPAAASPEIVHMTGLIETPDGIPVPDAVVAVYCAQGERVAPVLTLTSDGKGRYRLDLPVRRSSYRVTVTHPGLVQLEDSVEARVAGEFERDYRLHPAVVTLKGVVRNEQGQPIGAARVSLMLRYPGSSDTAPDDPPDPRLGAMRHTSPTAGELQNVRPKSAVSPFQASTVQETEGGTDGKAKAVRPGIAHQHAARQRGRRSDHPS